MTSDTDRLEIYFVITLQNAVSLRVSSILSIYDVYTISKQANCEILSSDSETLSAINTKAANTAINLLLLNITVHVHNMLIYI